MSISARNAGGEKIAKLGERVSYCWLVVRYRHACHGHVPHARIVLYRSSPMGLVKINIESLIMGLKLQILIGYSHIKNLNSNIDINIIVKF